MAFVQASITPLDQSLRESLKNYFYEGFIWSGMSWRMVDRILKKDAVNKLEHFDFTFVKALNSFKNSKDIKLPRQQMRYSTGYDIKRSYEQKIKSFIHEVILTNFIFEFELLMRQYL